MPGLDAAVAKALQIEEPGASALLRPGTDLARPEDTHRLAADVVVTTL